METLLLVRLFGDAAEFRGGRSSAARFPTSFVAIAVSIFAVGLGLLRSNIWMTAIAMLAGKFLRYVVWGWLTGLVF